MSKKNSLKEKNLGNNYKKKYPRPKYQYYIHFSNKMHFGYSLQAKLKIIYKSEKQYYLDYI